MMNWKHRAISATIGTQFGAILAAVTGEKIPAPYFEGRATITSDNFVMANFVDRNRQMHLGAFVGSVNDLIQNTTRLATHLHLTPEEKAELFTAIRGWIAADYSGGRLLKMLA